MGKLATMLQVGRTFGMRDGMLRLEYEIQRSSGLMLWRMRSRQGWESWDLKRITPGVRAEEMLAARQDGTRRFFFADAKNLGASIREIVGADGEESVLAEAERILAGNLLIFGRLSVACEFPPRWFRNPVTGQSVSPQQQWTQMRFASLDYGDLKFILEPSRFLFVYPLVRAYALSGDEQFAECFWTAIEDWARHSPPMAGPLWICGQECSLRILAWSFALHAFVNSTSTTNERVALLVSMIAAHAWRTAQTLGYARSQRSNHLFSEAVGLWTVGTLFPELKAAGAWQSLGARLLREAVLDQITPEGVHLQDSFNYQRMVLHLLLWTLRLAEIHHLQLPGEIPARTVAAFDFLRFFVDLESGGVPNHGSNDGTLILPLALCDYSDFKPLLQLGTAVLRRSSALAPGPWDEAGLWLCGNPGAASEVQLRKVYPDKAQPDPPLFPSPGYYRLGNKSSWAMVRAGHYSRRPFQADQLHVDLWWRGLTLAYDPGTYLYNGEPPWNNGLSGTAVHNTVMVDQRDQMQRAGRFLWVGWAQATGRSFSVLDKYPDCFEGEHDGYRRTGVRHRRIVQCLRDSGWVIVDDLLGTGEHEFRLHWLVPDLPLDTFCDSPFHAVFKANGARVGWHIIGSSPGDSAIIRAGRSSTPEVAGADTQLLGWQSPTYGELRPCFSLVYRTRARLPIRLVTTVLTGEGVRLEPGRERLVLWQGDSEVYQVRLLPESNPIGSPTRRE
jgi:hypothetical protein